MASKTGWCSLCRNPNVKLLNNAIAAGKGYDRALRDVGEFGLTFSKGTFLKHKEHITHPLVTDAAKALADPIVQPKSNRAALELIRDMGVKRAMDDPDAVNVNHALRAAKILQDAEGKQDAAYIILAKAVTGPLPEVYIGEYKELETED